MTDLVEAAVHAPYQLTDRVTRDQGTVFVSGVQALARVVVEQLRRDRLDGLRTAAFVSGYPGSPLAGFDKEIAIVAKMVKDELDLVAQPGLNEELAAASVMGSQLAMELQGPGGPRYDGVVGVWYGKAPGLDRASDAIRHAVFTGTHRYGGVIALVGDDPGAKSSTLPSSSDATMVDLHMPVMYPGDVQQALDLGRHGIALSRASGLWCAVKVVAGVADGTGTVDLDLQRVQPIIPEVEVDGKLFVPHPSGRLIGTYTLDLERQFHEIRFDLARQYAAENKLNHFPVDPPDARIGIASTGYTYVELREALRRLGLATDAEVAAAGIRLLELRMPIPLDQAIMRRFAEGLGEIIVVEEKNPTLEWSVKDALYANAERPTVVGKRDEQGSPLFPPFGHLDADAILVPLRRQLVRVLPDMAQRLAPLPVAARPRIALDVARSPFFCSGCPHNWGTKVPEGSLAGAGIGCHAMTMLMEPERVGEFGGVGAMGTEGAQWIGMAPFVGRKHFIQNLGDGTFFHSGHLAIRSAVAANVNITYKLLYNGTVAMTGGQHAQGSMPVPAVARSLLLEGVRRIIVTTEDVGRYAKLRNGAALPKGVDVWDRERIVEAQEVLSAVEGVTVLIHDQACAAETRRARRRGKAATPKFKVVINQRVCEGCGDCGDVSNCLSVQPLDTPFGRKTTIDQASCNMDLSCVKGDCPSFMTVEARPGSGHTGADVLLPPSVPDAHRLVDPGDCTIRMPGIGGTGVVTISQLVGTAAMLDGLTVRGLDQTGLSQKAGPVVSDLHVRRSTDEPRSNKAVATGVDLYLAFDLLVADAQSNLDTLSPQRTIVVASTSATATGEMVIHPTIAYPDIAALRARLEAVTRPDASRWVDAAYMAQALVGDGQVANVFLLGVAYQAGALPVAAASLEKAIELNGVAVEHNLAAFRWGRAWAVDPVGVQRIAAGRKPALTTPAVALPKELATQVAAFGEVLEAPIRIRTEDLCAYQNVRYAQRYLATLARVREVEQRVRPGSAVLTDAVARNLYKLMAYKDEYEVARLLLSSQATAEAEAVGGPGAKVVWHLHPPMLRSMGMNRKLKLGAWARPVMSGLARAKAVRGTPLDVFGYAPMRRMERTLVTEYTAALTAVLAKLGEDNFDEIVAIAELPDGVRGYEDLKMRRAAAYREQLALRVAAIV